MLNSRSLDDLNPTVKLKCLEFLHLCKEDKIDIIVTSTYRDFEAQDALYAQGRTTSGKIVTNARPGDSWHNWKCAIDVVPTLYGKPVWGTSGTDGELWRKVGILGEQSGLEWAGRWTGKLKEMAHFQYTQGLSLSDFKAGKKIA